MSHPPSSRTEFWIRFGFGCLFFGFVNGLIGLRYVDSAGWIPAASVACGATLAMSLFVARVGDDGWRRLMSLLRWW